MATPQAPATLKHGARASVSSAEALRRQRQSDSVVLAQIVGRAIRLRAATETVASPVVGGATSTPLTLVELIQASTAVFEKHGIRPPQDATFHRHLLALSMDPEPDWEKKIKRFAVKRLTTGSDGVSSQRAASVASANRRRSDIGVESTALRQRRGVGSGDASSTRWIPPRSVAAKTANKRQPVDRFSDIVAAPVWQSMPNELKLKENQLRNAVAAAKADVATETDSVEKPVTPAQKLHKLESIRSKLNDITEGLAMEGGDNEDVGEEDDQLGEELVDERNERDELLRYTTRRPLLVGQASDTTSESSPLVAPLDFHPSPEGPSTPLPPSQPLRRGMPENAFRLLATTFQQWRELTRFQRLVHESRQRELRLTQAVMPPVATFAVFRCILFGLPARIDAASRRNVSQAVPSYVLARGIDVSNPRLLRHFTGRLLVWAVHRIFQCWAVHARAVKVARIKSLLRERTLVLETASECLYRWQKHTKKRRRVSDHGVWLETLRARRQLRASLRAWRDAWQRQQREDTAQDQYARKQLKRILTGWHRVATQRRAARACGATWLLIRVLRAWRNAVGVSDREQRLLRTADGHFARRVARVCWVSWRIRATAWKRKRLKGENAVQLDERKRKRRVWRAWTQTQARIMEFRKKTAQFVRRQEARLLRSILSRLGSYVTHKRSCSLLVMDALARREWRALTTGWRHWQQHLESTTLSDERLIQQWVSRRRARFWTVWKQRTSVMKLSATLRSFFHASVLREAWSTWTAWAEKQRHYRRLLRECRGERDQILQLDVFRAFRENVRRGHVKNEAVRGFLRRSAEFRLQAFVWAWRDVAKVREARRRRDARLVSVWNANRLRTCWTTWRSAFHVARCVHVADQAMAHSLQRRCFSCWRRAVRTRHRNHAVVRGLHRFHRRRAVGKWRSRVERNRHWRLLQSELRARHGAFALLVGWNVWRRQFFEAKKRHERVRKAVLQWQNRRLELVFSEWRDFHVRRTHLRQLLVQWWSGTQRKNVAGCWRVWRKYIAMRHDKRHDGERAKRFYSRTLLHKTVGEWRYRCRHSQEKLVVMQRCVGQWNNSQQRRMFSRWIEFARLRRVLRSMSVQTDRRRLGRTFSSWRTWRAVRFARAAEQSDAALALQDWRMRSAVQRLRLHVRTAKRMASIRGLVVLAGSRGLQAALLRTWKVFVLVEKQNRLLTASHAAHMLRFRQLRSVRRWEQLTRIKKLLSATLLKVLTRSSSGLRQRVFSAWRQYVAQRRMFYALKEKALVFQVSCLLPTYFHAWKLFVTAQSHKQQLVLKASRLLCHQREARALKAWVEFVERNKQVRKALTQWRSQSFLQRFSQWKTFTQARKWSHKALQHWETSQRRRALCAWAKEARQQRLLRHFSALWHVQTTEQSFAKWKRHVRTARSARALLRRLRNGSLSRVLNSWKAFSNSQSQRSSRIRARFALLWDQNRLMTSFQRWKAVADTQKLLKRRILQRMHHHIGFCFQRWQAAVSWRKTLAVQAKQIAIRDQKRVMREAWGCWRSEKASRNAIHALRRRVLSSYAEASARLVLSKWRQWTLKTVEIKAVQRRRSQYVVRRLFLVWKLDFVRRQQNERSIAAQIQKLQEAGAAKRVLRRMRARLAIKNACAAVFLPQLQRHAMATTWRAWCNYHTRKRATKAAVQSVHEKICQRDVAYQRAARVCLQRWKSLGQFHVFTHWFRATATLKWTRLHTICAVQTWQVRLTLRVFDAWRLRTKHQKTKRAIRRSGARHRQARVWRRWVFVHEQHQLQAAATKRADGLRAKNLQTAVVRAWRRAVSRRRRHLLLAASITLRRTQRSIRTWHAMAVDRKARRLQLTVARVVCHHNCVSAAWQQWATFVRQVRSHRLELQQHTERLQILVLCSTFRAWHAWSHRQRKISRVLRLLTARCDAKTASRVLGAWTRYARTKKLGRSAASQFVFERGVRRAICELRRNALDATAQRAGVRRAREWIQVLQGRHVASMFRRWTALTARAKRTRALVRRYQLKKLLPASFLAWQSFVRMELSKSDRLARAVGCWQSISARRAWNAWLAFYRRRAETLRQSVSSHRHFVSRLLRLVLLGWRSTVVKKTLLGETCRRLLVRWKMQTAYRCFANWQSHVLRCKARRVSCAIISSRQANGVARVAWTEWRRQFVVCRVGHRKRLGRCWTAWRQWREDKQRWRAFQTRQTLVLLHTVRARQGVHRWKRFVVYAKLSKTMALLSSRFSRDTLAKRCFERWLQFLILNHKEKDKTKKVLAWLHSRQLMVAFQALHTHAVQRQAKTRSLQKAISYARQKTQRRQLVAWRRVVSTTKTQREKLRRYVSIMQHVSQRKSVAAWREFSWKRRHLRQTYATLMSQRSLVTSQTLFQAWKTVVAKRKRYKTATRFHESTLSQRSLAQWRRFVVLSRVERMLGASEQRVIERAFVGWRKRTVLDQSVRRLEETKREQWRRELVVSHFQAWRSWSRIRTKCASLLASVAVGNHLRFRFLVWKRFHAQRKRLQVLLGSVQPTTTNQQGLLDRESPAMQLARMARFFQQFEVAWDDSAVVWQRWRHVFHACLFYRIRRLHRVHSAWRRWSRRRGVVRNILRTRQVTNRFAMQRTVLRQWHEVVTTVQRIQRERRRERELWLIVNAEILRQERKALQRHWTAWRERTEDKRHLLVSVDSYQRARMLTKCWLLWSHDFVNAARIQRKEDANRSGRLNVLKARRAIAQINSHRVWTQRAWRLVRFLSSCRHSRWSRVCFDQWRAFADTRRRVRLLSMFKKRQFMQWILREWRWQLEFQKNRRRDVEAFVYRRTRVARVWALARWRRYVLEGRRSEDAAAIATGFRLQKCVRTRWLGFVQSRKMWREQQRRAETRLAEWRARRAVGRWHAIAHSTVLSRKLRGFVLQKHFAAWKLYLQIAIAEHWRLHQLHKQVARAFSLWAERARTGLRLRATEQELVDRRAVRNAHHVWLRWLEAVEYGRKKHAARSHHDSALKFKSFLRWCDQARATAAHRLSQFVLAKEYASYRVQRRALRLWVAGVRSSQQRRVVLLTCVVKIKRCFRSRLQEAIFHAWADAVDRARYTRECAAFLTRQRVARSLRNWRQQIVDRQRRDQLGRDAVARRRNRLLSIVFFHWQNYALAWKDAERLRGRAAMRTRPSPAAPTREARDDEEEEGEEDDQESFRRPLSPMRKRFHAKQSQRQPDRHLETEAPMPSLSEAATLSLDVKKRLLLLGQWKPSQKSLTPS